MLFKAIPKDPVAALDYKFVWSSPDPAVSPWLQSGETISLAVLTVPAGLTKESQAIVDSGRNVVVWLSGGTAGVTYTVTCKITTSTSRTDSRSISIVVQNR